MTDYDMCIFSELGVLGYFGGSEGGERNIMNLFENTGKRLGVRKR